MFFRAGLPGPYSHNRGVFYVNTTDPLKNIRIVLCGTAHPGNIGAAARAMRTMGITDLVLVNPQRYPDPQAVWMAAGATDVLEAARICGSLGEALTGVAFAVACSARRRDVAVPMVIVPAAAVGCSGHETKAELDANAPLIARLDRMRVEAGLRMGLGDCSALVVPKPVLVAAPAGSGSIASRDFVPFNCHATYSVTGSIALSVACRIGGTVASRLARPQAAAPGVISIEHPGGVIDVGVRLRESGSEIVLEEASLLRTCRKLFEGQICIPARVWDGAGRAASAAQIAAGLGMPAATL